VNPHPTLIVARPPTLTLTPTPTPTLTQSPIPDPVPNPKASPADPNPKASPALPEAPMSLAEVIVFELSLQPAAWTTVRFALGLGFG
jgi:hypothetical protein